MSQMEYEPNAGNGKTVERKTEDKPGIGNTKKIESFKYGIYNLIFGLLQTRIKPAGKGVKKWGRR